MRVISALFLVAVQAFFSTIAVAQSERFGSIKGVVIDVESKEPLYGANVVIKGTQMGDATDDRGEFEIANVPVGSYSLVTTYIGYEALAKSDVIVKSQRITFAEIGLKLSSVQMKGVEVHAGYFTESEVQPTSAIGFSGEEIRRHPGTAGDVSRIVMGLPSVAKVGDTRNSLIVRGGGPTENGFYIDNIEIPNINHFPEQGSSGGPIGMVNVDFIRDVSFYTGGFSAVYGDRLSSVMDIKFRKGNPDDLDLQLDMNFAGFGVTAEGGLPGNRGSWLVSARRSFLDLIVTALNEDETSIPQYSDVQGKVFLDLSPRHKLTILNILAIDKFDLSGKDAIETEENLYTDFGFVTNTVGANWLYLWGKKGHSQTSLANTTSAYDFTGYETRTFRETGSDRVVFDLQPLESEFKLRNVNHYRFTGSSAVDFGVEANFTAANYDNLYGVYYDQLGNQTREYRVDDNIKATKLFAFSNFDFNLLPRLTVTPGIRLGHFTYNNNTNISPRLSLKYDLTPTSSVSASAGVFHQYLPLPLLTQNSTNKNLSDPVSYHFILGFHKLLTEDTKLTLEAYHKEYDHFPMDATQRQLFILDQVLQTSVYYNGNSLVDNGKARTQGVELMLQKKLAKNFYGLVSGSYFRSRYRDFDGEWRNRTFDNRVTLQVEGGYKPNSKWEFSLRWLFAGGRPYTPFDEAASAAAGHGILDVNRINGARLPDYHSLNIRFDRRFHYRGSNLLFYLSVWNAYGRKNLQDYQWNEITNKQDEFEQWGLLPVFGLEYEF